MSEIKRLPYRRVIPCLDFKDGRVVKGVQFIDLQDAGDPLEFAERYIADGADELAFLDIAATVEARPTLVSMVQALSEHCSVPFAVGGGMASLADIQRVLSAGADMVSINSAAVRQPELIDAAVAAHGSARIIVAVDAIHAPGRQDAWHCVIDGGQLDSGLDAVQWAEEAARRGAGEILLTSRDRDGAQDGYDLALTRAVARAVDIPVVASGGVGRLEDFAAGILEGEADAVLAASVFHFGTFTVRQVKEYLASQGIPVQLTVGASAAATAAGLPS